MCAYVVSVASVQQRHLQCSVSFSCTPIFSKTANICLFLLCTFCHSSSIMGNLIRKCCCPTEAICKCCCPTEAICKCCCPTEAICKCCCPTEAIGKCCCPTEAICKSCCPTEAQSPNPAQVPLVPQPPSGQTAPPPAVGPSPFQPSSGQTVPSPVIGRLNNPLYINWLKAVRGLVLTIDVLRGICDTEMQAWHRQLVSSSRWGNTQCSGSCSAKDVKNLKVPRCRTGVCPTWLAAIQLERRRPNTRLIANNADINQLPKEYWQVAKLFMNPGQDAASVLSSDTDASGIINLIQNCKRFVNIIDSTKTDAVSITHARVHTQSSIYTHYLVFDAEKSCCYLLCKHPGLRQKEPRFLPCRGRATH